MLQHWKSSSVLDKLSHRTTFHFQHFQKNKTKLFHRRSPERVISIKLIDLVASPETANPKVAVMQLPRHSFIHLNYSIRPSNFDAAHAKHQNEIPTRKRLERPHSKARWKGKRFARKWTDDRAAQKWARLPLSGRQSFSSRPELDGIGAPLRLGEVSIYSRARSVSAPR